MIGAPSGLNRHGEEARNRPKAEKLSKEAKGESRTDQGPQVVHTLRCRQSQICRHHHVTGDDCGRRGTRSKHHRATVLAGDHQTIDVPRNFKLPNKAARDAAFHHTDGDGAKLVMNDDPDKGPKLFHGKDGESIDFQVVRSAHVGVFEAGFLGQTVTQWGKLAATLLVEAIPAAHRGRDACCQFTLVGGAHGVRRIETSMLFVTKLLNGV